MTHNAYHLIRLVMCLALVVFPAVQCLADATERGPQVRTFRFTYGARLSGLPAGGELRVWLPRPSSNDHQQVELLADRFPARARVTTEPRYGNQLVYFELPAPATGEVTLQSVYHVRRREVRGLEPVLGRPVRPLTDRERELYLSANARVPVGGRPATLLEGLNLPADPLALARTLYNRVDEHLTYDKSRPGFGRGDAVWACDSRFGNCTDFHSLFISLARSRNVPARFEIGFALPTERGQGTIGGYHCWGFFHVDGLGWVPVDISEADKQPDLKEYYFGNLTADRVTFSTGRDLVLEPKQAGPPLNFLVYPYVEVDGQPLPPERIEPRLRFADQPG
ncbi:MAG: transglutaminase domain-containing protein [Pirellulaceae bacterium]|nr:transglutaminase domain-containing protein [Pirellulaceae bacterium]